MHKEPMPEYTWVVKQFQVAPQLRFSPDDLASAFATHCAWVSDYGHNALYRAHNNLSGIPFCDGVLPFNVQRGQPNADGRIARFASLADFVDCYLFVNEHLLKSSAREFFAHMQKNDLTPNARRRWAKIVEVWEKHFAERPITI
jgi:hypothetical protein